ncbi:MAG: alpha-glucosidase [Sphingomonas sp.]|nr:alpha-glucosidase [Sphingomonas sp.]
MAAARAPAGACDSPLRFVMAVMLALLMLFPATLHAQTPQRVMDAAVQSPDGRLEVRVDTQADIARYAVYRDGQPVIAPSKLGFLLNGSGKFEHGIFLGAPDYRDGHEEWDQPWGEKRHIAMDYREMRVPLLEQVKDKRRIDLVIRAFDTGIGFRFEFPPQPQFDGPIAIDDELTEFNIAGAGDTWWIPAGEWNRYEYIYNKTPIDQVGTAHTPFTIRRADGLHLAIHEAALVDYAGMWLQRIDGQRFRSHLAPGPSGPSVIRDAPFHTPWRTIQIADDAAGLYAASDMTLALNEPNKLGDVSWVKPMKYIGIWWAMQIGDWTWEAGPRHGATTEHAKRYIDFAAANGFGGVLIEGWNKGWEGNWIGDSGRNLDFTHAYPDFDIEAVAAYARSKGVELIGHHETAGNVGRYEDQMADAYALDERLGVHAVKTGYVADAGGVLRQGPDGENVWEWHDGQYMANHHVRVAELAARHHVGIDAHEPIKDTGLRRTYPNLLSREGARGMEYAAWGEPTNPPSHEPTLVFTRMLSGPMDYTPGVVSLTGKEGRAIPSTLARQLAYYVVLYSPVQMAADLPENYEKAPRALDFIRQVPVDWERSIVLGGEIGEFAVFARQERGADNWYVGGITDDHARSFDVDFSFLPPGKRYSVTLWQDGETGGIDGDRFAMDVRTFTVTSEDKRIVAMKAGGGFAMSLQPVE